MRRDELNPAELERLIASSVSKREFGTRTVQPEPRRAPLRDRRPPPEFPGLEAPIVFQQPTAAGPTPLSASAGQAAPLARFATAPVRYSAAGFLAGIAVSHLIGFWGFMSDIISGDGAAERLAVSQPARPNGNGHDVVTGSLQSPKPKNDCVRVVRDPVTGTATGVSCNRDLREVSEAMHAAGAGASPDTGTAPTTSPDPATGTGPSPDAASGADGPIIVRPPAN